jgi:homoserine kinase
LIKNISVTVPASSGNLGPGFDVWGMALTLRNELHVRVLSSLPKQPLIHVMGEGESTVLRDSSNVVFKALARVFKLRKKTMPPLELVCVNRIPLARGLGSSSAAILSGLLAGNELLGRPWSLDDILLEATKMEGHPDNVAPALLGGIRAAGVFEGKVISYSFPHGDFKAVVAIPSFELSTKKARKVLPKMVSMQDAVQNLSAMSLFSNAIKSNLPLLKSILNEANISVEELIGLL